MELANPLQDRGQLIVKFAEPKPGVDPRGVQRVTKGPQASKETYAQLWNSSYPDNLKLFLEQEQQRFSNIKSRVILGITRRKLSWHYRRDKLGINSGKEKMAAHFDDDDDDLW